MLEDPKLDEVLRITGSGITLTNNEVKDNAKVIRSLENGRTTIKTISQEGGFLNFLKPLMTAGLPLMKSVLTHLAKSVFTAAASTKDSAIQKKIFLSGVTTLIFSNKELDDIMISSKIPRGSWFINKGC